MTLKKLLLIGLVTTLTTILAACSGEDQAVTESTVSEPAVSEATISELSAAAVDLLPPQKPSSGVSKLEIHLNLNLDAAAAAASAAAADDDAVPAIATPPVARIVVGLSLSAAATAVTPNPLAQWKADGPFAAGDWN